MKKLLSIILAASLFVSIPLVKVQANETMQDSPDSKINELILESAESWIENNYKEFYNLRNVQSRIVKCEENNNEARYLVSISCDTNYKCQNASDIPLIKGIQDVISSSDLKDYELSALETFVDDISKDAFSEEWAPLNIDIYVDSNTGGDELQIHYYDDGLSDVPKDIAELRLDYDELYNLGIETAEYIIANANPESVGTNTYNRYSARNYSRQYTSNASSCDYDNCSSVKRDTSKWNTSQYSYTFGHNDCADFVSQALSKGGIPETTSGTSTWYRTKYGSYGTWSTNWTTVSGLTSYMTSHSYWVSTTYAGCLYGEVMITNSGGHVVMVDYNDGTTHRFNGHTNDRVSYAFSNSSSYSFYNVQRMEYPTS